jgi:UDP-N-acetylglucosamine 4,6-dehydratase/5-epimerase
MTFNGKSVLITGGTGSFGQKFVENLLQKYRPKKLVVFSRDELKQFEMQRNLSVSKYPNLRFFIGDVRDRSRLTRAFSEIDIVVHAAAMKQVVAAEYNPSECVATNILGAQNVIDSSIENGVQKVIALSTDKAANPINLYGATKLCSDKLFIAANNLSGRKKTRFSVVRYGNVAGSRGSVIPYFNKLIEDGHTVMPITHDEMTRFIITLDQGVDFVISSLFEMYGGEIFVPKLPSIRIKDLIPHFGSEIRYEIVGIRPGEKVHEVMIPEEEMRNSIDFGKYYIIQPNHHWWNVEEFKRFATSKGKLVQNHEEYSSGTNDEWLEGADIKRLLKKNPY